MSQPRLVLIVLGLLVAISSSAAAQAPSSLNGHVVDSTGAPISGARVELLSGERVVRAATTDRAGGYRIEGLLPGEYVARALAPGFERAEQKVTIAPSAAASADLTLSVEGILESVEVVAAAGYARPAGELPVSATVVTRETALASPARSIDGLLRDVAGVQLQGFDAESLHPMVPSLAMRGVGVGDSADRGLVLVDGLPINGGFFGHINWNRAPKQTIDRIEIVRGASSSLFGSYAMGGVVDIVTRVPAARETDISLLYGENERAQANLFHGGVAGTKSAYSLNANLFDTSGFYTVPEEDRRPVDTRLASRLWNLQGRFDSAPGNGTRLFIKGAFDQEDRDGPYVNASTERTLFDVAGGGGKTFGSSTLDVRAIVSREEFTVRNVRIVGGQSTFIANPHDSESTNVMMSAVWSKAMTGAVANLTAGADLRRVDGSDDQLVYNSPGQLSAEIVGGGVQSSLGGFAQVSVHPTDGSEILASARLDRFADSDGAITTNGATESFHDRTLTIPSFRVAGRVQATPAFGIRAAAFKGFNAPTLATLYRSFESPTFRGLSNPELTEERLIGGDGGVEIRTGRFSGQFNGFFNRVEDFLGSEEVGFVNGKFTVRLANVAAIESRGVEAMGEVRVSHAVTFGGQYTFTDAEVSEGELEGNAVEGAPRHAGGLSATYASVVATATLKVRYVSESYQDITNEALQDARWLVDFLVAKPLGRRFEVLVTGENIFNTEYVADGFGGTLGAPRQLSAGVRVRF